MTFLQLTIDGKRRGKSIRLQDLSSDVDRWMAALAHPEDVMSTIASVLEAQTRTRLSDEKKTPQGKTWPAWTPAYAKTRQPGHSLLVDTQNLLDSIASTFTNTSASVGSNVQYADYVQNAFSKGDRRYLGLSKENVIEITDVVNEWLKEVIS